jgi:Cys-rich protein (TIGR01571 family)
MSQQHTAVPEFDLAEKQPQPQQQQQQQAQHFEQPQHQMGTVVHQIVAGGNVRAMTTWSTDLCGCFQHGGSVLDAVFCPWCQMSRQYNTMTTGDNNIHWASCLSAFGADVVGAATIGVGVGSWFFAYLTRNRLRQRYSIVGDELTDILTAGFCHCCVVSQNFREMSIRNEYPSGTCCGTEPYALIAPGVAVMGESSQ